MLKTQFKDQLEFDIYLAEQKDFMERGYLTRSEREQLKKMMEKDYKPAFIKEEPKKIARPLITNYNLLRIPCQEVTKEDSIAGIIQDLKDGLEVYGGLGISANQLGIQKKISYIKVPFMTPEKKIEMKEIILINAEIIEKDRPIVFKGEGCTSFPGLRIDTKRYVFIVATNYNEKLEPNTLLSQDLEGIVLQHEIDHQNGITVLERKYKK